jgi:hypothetical protein
MTKTTKKEAIAAIKQLIADAKDMWEDPSELDVARDYIVGMTQEEWTDWPTISFRARKLLNHSVFRDEPIEFCSAFDNIITGLVLATWELATDNTLRVLFGNEPLHEHADAIHDVIELFCIKGREGDGRRLQDELRARAVEILEKLKKDP